MIAAGGEKAWRGALALAIALFAAQAMLWLNPGYFSHDELQWGARAAVESWRQLPFVSFLDWRAFQFRPLTFNLWLLLSHALFESPRAFHAAFVALGTFNALLLASTLRRVGCDQTVAHSAALVFALGPVAAWVHGWVGCLADLLWLALLLAALRALLALHPPKADPIRSPWLAPTTPARLAAAAGIGALTTALGLLAKEAALSIPALIGLVALALRLPRAWLAATIAGGAVALAYLALRLAVLASAPGDSTYGIQPAWLPGNWLLYQAFPGAIGIQEVQVLARARDWRWLPALFGLGALVACLWRASPKLALGWLVGVSTAVAPVLLLAYQANQYAYGAMACSCAAGALAWRHLDRWHARLLALAAALSVVHGVQIQKRMLYTGRLQATFSAELVTAAQRQPQGAIALWPELERDHPIYARLSHELLDSAGTRLGSRVQMAPSRAAANHRITADGRVLPMEHAP